MFVIIKNIHRNITIGDMERFVTPAINGWFFQKRGKIQALKIIQVIDRKGRAVERHGVVRVLPDTIKNRVIRSLNGRMIGAQNAVISEYVIRQWQNDRRAASLKRFSPPMDNRKGDRRRSGIRKVTLSEKSSFEPAVP